MTTLISVERDDCRFIYRAAGAAIHQGRVLLSRAEFDDFWALPGGRVELMEPSTRALERELREEIGAAVEVGRLLWVHENFFTHQGRRFHALELYYEMGLAPGSPALAQDEILGSGDMLLTGDGPQAYGLVYRWFPVDQLESTPLYPIFLRRGLQSLPQAVAHLVHQG